MPEHSSLRAMAPGCISAGRSARALLLATTLLATALPSFANDAAALAPDPALEARVMQVATELRCLVCQNQTIADSNAALAVDLRQQIRERLQRGESQDQILGFMTERYGDYVLYRPPLKAATLALWATPFVLLLAGLLCLAAAIRQRRAAAAAAPEAVSEADADRARHLLSPVHRAPTPGPHR